MPAASTPSRSMQKHRPAWAPSQKTAAGCQQIQRLPAHGETSSDSARMPEDGPIWGRNPAGTGPERPGRGPKPPAATPTHQPGREDVARIERPRKDAPRIDHPGKDAPRIGRIGHRWKDAPRIGRYGKDATASGDMRRLSKDAPIWGTSRPRPYPGTEAPPRNRIRTERRIWATAGRCRRPGPLQETSNACQRIGEYRNHSGECGRHPAAAGHCRKMGEHGARCQQMPTRSKDAEGWGRMPADAH